MLETERGGVLVLVAIVVVVEGAVSPEVDTLSDWSVHADSAATNTAPITRTAERTL